MLETVQNFDVSTWLQDNLSWLGTPQV